MESGNVPEKHAEGGESSKDHKGKLVSPRLRRWRRKMKFQPQDVKLKKNDMKFLAARNNYYKTLTDPEKDDEIVIPRAVPVAVQAESCATEMKMMMQAVSQHTSNRGVMQRLPHHMRRRASSHNPKRLPRRLREVAAALEAKAGGQRSKKRSALCRKKRRRKRIAANEYAKRAGKQGWLETHIWHAKRFHMTESTDPMYQNWGNRVALQPNDKSFRACYRAISKHCLIQDISYLRCLEMSGTKKDICSILKSVCEQPNFSPDVMNGIMEADILLHRQVGDSPYTSSPGRQCIGPASVMWRPSTEDTHTVWMWIHPACFSFAKEALESSSTFQNSSTKMTDLSDQLMRFRLTGPKSSVTLMSVLRPMIECSPAEETRTSGKLEEWLTSNQRALEQTHRDFFQVLTDCHRQIFAKAGTAASTDERLHGSTFSVVTDDPRLTLPLTKVRPSLTNTTVKLEKSEVENDEDCSERNILQDNPLWCGNIRDEVSNSRLPDHVVSTRKRQLKFPFSDSEQNEWESSLSTPVPVIVIRKIPLEKEFDDVKINLDSENGAEDISEGDCCSSSFTSGWDLILPRGWGTAFWIPFIYHKARAGGLRESRNCSLECLIPHFPEDFPDTESAGLSWDAEAKKKSDLYYRKPPAKRPNYLVMGVKHPFQPNWEDLFSESVKEKENRKNVKRSSDELKIEDQLPAKKLKLSTNGESVIVEHESADGKTEENGTQVDEHDSQCHIQSKDATANLDKTGSIAVKDQTISVIRGREDLLQMKKWIDSMLSLESPPSERTLENPFPAYQRCLVGVRILALSKGVPFPCSMICLPSDEDIQTFCNDLCDPYKYGLQSLSGPVEPKHWDIYKKSRKAAKLEAKKNKRKKKSKDPALVTSEDKPQPEKQTTFPVKPMIFPVLSTRTPIGYVTSGNFLYSYACGGGLGFVSVDKLFSLVTMIAGSCALRKLFENDDIRNSLLGKDLTKMPLLALMRNTDSPQYRFISIKLMDIS